jgi:hypothetical protein
LETTKSVIFLFFFLVLCNLIFFSCKCSGHILNCSWYLQVLLEPLGRLKQADSRLKMTQGVLEGVGI